MEFSIQSLSPIQWAILLLAALFIGMAKGGISNLGMSVVPLTAWYFGGKFSTGLILPMLIVADFTAVLYYRKNAEWKYYWKLLPWTIVGVVFGTWLGQVVDDLLFKRIMGVIFAGSVAFMLYRDYRGITTIPHQWWFAASMGILAGVTTMFGNLAGAATTVFFLAMQLPKQSYLGTAAWFFFSINLFKTPFQIFFWGTISWDTIQINLLLVPVLLFGVAAGIWLVQRFSDRFFRRMTISLCIVAMVLLFL
ncbi:MAG: sulfite exporter TauE/SafE family protein [Haliscomenobacter sp.]|uniref:sulfite exporter TauE/SafE family protein n=1 Tax=Haliscomenobacter sp. TaxID=2717303 RepID=UPI0029B15CE0|nr:sulfite exporter TauE/SafE family protein [Haliscomenobacter sp.]MDX2069340.1 sulfite exporter TauE/SafE family protein [Haliscomenobacter sp.]